MFRSLHMKLTLILLLLIQVGGLGYMTLVLMTALLLGKKIGDIVVLAPPMLKMLPTMFAWPQLVTALTGGIIALTVLPVLRKALHK